MGVGIGLGRVGGGGSCWGGSVEVFLENSQINFGGG